MVSAEGGCRLPFSYYLVAASASCLPVPPASAHLTTNALLKIWGKPTSFSLRVGGCSAPEQPWVSNTCFSETPKAGASPKFFFKKSKFSGHFFFFFWLRWVFIVARAFSSWGEWGLSSLWCTGFSLRSRGSRCVGFSSCGTRAQLWYMGSVVVARGSRAQ